MAHVLDVESRFRVTVSVGPLSFKKLHIFLQLQLVRLVHHRLHEVYKSVVGSGCARELDAVATKRINLAHSGRAPGWSLNGLPGH